MVRFGVLAVFALAGCSAPTRPAGGGSAAPAESAAAFLAAYPVFMHPRCANCHPDGDVPLVGDEGVPHPQEVRRGSDGRGRFASTCTNCHQPDNVAGAHMPPGSANWRMPPAAQPMVFVRRTPAQLAAQLKDPGRNGGKSLDEILEHVAEDGLVLWGWNPGDGRTTPPVNHEEFVRQLREWVRTGAVVPP